MTQIPIVEIPEEGLPVSYSEDPAELDLAVQGARFLQPITVDLVLAKAAHVISATGCIRVSATCECVWCLSPFQVQLDIPVATQFLPAQPPLPPGEYQMPPEEAEDYYYQDGVVVLDDLVRQEVILAVPFSPQCRAECRGLCPQCGQDLNVGTCACAPPPDPRWAALRGYLKGK
jgi:uncharacterized metal-binding protein YceD (DUF177 family)